jgi:hypothetical protein
MQLCPKIANGRRTGHTLQRLLHGRPHTAAHPESQTDSLPPAWSDLLYFWESMTLTAIFELRPHLNAACSTRLV